MYCNLYTRMLGLCNNYAYVIMLSAAFDILGEEAPSRPTEPPPVSAVIESSLSNLIL